MANVRLLYNSATWDAATVASSSETGDLVDNNVADNRIGKVWRSTGVASEYLKFSLSGAAQFTCFGVFAANFTAAATVTLEANATDVWTSPSYSQALTIATDSDGNVLPRIVLFLDQTYRYWRLTMADPTNTAGYLQIGRVIAGLYYEPPRNVSDGFAVETIDPSEGTARPGSLAVFRRHMLYRRASVDFSYATQTQADKLAAAFAYVGNRWPVVLALDPTNRPSTDSLYCRLTSPLRTVHAMTGQYNQGTLVFEEISQ